MVTPSSTDGAQPSRAPAPAPFEIRSAPDFVEHLGRLRRAAERVTRSRLSVDRIATITAIPRSTVHAYLSGVRLPPPDNLDRLVIALGATPEEQAAWADALDRVQDAARSGPSLTSEQQRSPVPTVPRQLPGRPTGFVGRHAELRAVTATLTAEPGAGARILNVTGPGGIGKTALVNHCAHDAARCFPDGQLWVDLRGYGTSEPLRTLDALERMIRALGHDTGDLPFDLDDRAAVFRTALADRRILLVLDNARDSAQVRPLLPGSSNATTVVTSRDHLRSLALTDGAERIELGELGGEDALDLLRAAPGTRTDPELAARIAAQCGGVPLALRIAAERLAGAVDGEATAFVESLEADGASRLAALDLNDPSMDLSVSEVLAWSYRALAPESALTFRRVALCRVPVVDLDCVTVLCDLDEQRTRHHLDLLVAANLLERVGLDRYRIHDLVAAFAESCLVRDDAPDTVRAATDRLLDALEARLDGILESGGYPVEARPRPPREEPGTSIDTVADGGRWILAHRDLIEAVVSHAVDRGELVGHFRLLTVAVTAAYPFGFLTSFAGLLLRVSTVASEHGDPSAAAGLAICAGILQFDQGRTVEAETSFVTADRLVTRSAAEPVTRAQVNLARLWLLDGQLDRAAAVLEDTADRQRGAGRTHRPVRAGSPGFDVTMIELHLHRGDLDAARLRADHAVERATQLPPHNIRRLYAELAAGEVAHACRTPAASELADDLERRIRLTTSPDLLARVLTLRCRIEAEAGRTEAASRHGHEAQAISRRVGFREIECRATVALAQALVEAGAGVQALAELDAIATRGRLAGLRHLECEALVVSAAARRSIGDVAGSAQDAAAATGMAERFGYRRLAAAAQEITTG